MTLPFKFDRKQTNLPPEQLSAVLMSFIHDIKNSLLVSVGGLETLYMQLENLQPEQQRAFSQIQYELSRINNDLVQLLSMYKLETSLFSVNVDQYNIYDFLEELLIINTPLNKQQDFSFSLECDEDIDWFFDKDLIGTVINSTINNSIRYAKSRIIISAHICNDFLHIQIEDDGPGFPDKMLMPPDSLETAINMQYGSTGLGLYFAGKIAQIHHNNNQHGSTQIDNQSCIGGGRFTLLLP